MTRTGTGLLLLLLACDGTAGRPQTPPSTPEPPSPPAVVDPSAPACALPIIRVAAYQTVEIPLRPADGEAAFAPVDLVANRPTLVRVFVTHPAPGTELEVSAQLAVEGGAPVTEGKPIVEDSLIDDKTSTFNLLLPPELARDTRRVHVEVRRTGACQGAPARWPASGEATLSFRQTGTLRVVLVPIRYDADGSGRTPEVGEDVLDRYRNHLRALYPSEEVEFTVREVVGTTLQLRSGGWADLLESLRRLRAEDGAPPEVYYYGLVMPGSSLGAYCRGACVAGIAYRVGGGGNAGLRVGVGVGFGDAAAAETMAHELGHGHGLGHSPCGTKEDVDASYPYEGGSIGVWGWDNRTGGFRDPATYSDVMGYCARTWMSDYTYRALTERNAEVNLRPAGQALTLATRYRGLLVEGGRARWSFPADGLAPVGTAVAAFVRDAAGAVIAELELVRIDHGDGGGSLYLVPWPEPGWVTLEIPGVASIAFDAPNEVPPLTP